MSTFAKGQKVKHPKVAVSMEVVGLVGLAAMTASNGAIYSSASSDMKIICKYIKNGKTVQKSFKKSELKPL